MPRRLVPAFAAASLILMVLFAGIAQATSTPPVSLTAANTSFPPQLRAWLPPNKNTTLGALGRAAASIFSSTSDSPLNAAAAVARGLELYKSETSKLLRGDSGVVNYAPFANTSTNQSGDLICYVSETGQLVGLQQSSSLACSSTNSAVVVPTSTPGSFISQIKLGYSYDGLFIARLIFYLKANAAAKPVSYSCGSAGGKAVDLLPNSEQFVVTKLKVGCQPLPAIDSGGFNFINGVGGGRRSLLQQPGLLGLSAGTFRVTAAPLASLPTDSKTKLPIVPLGTGEILAPDDPLPTPTPTPATTPSPTSPSPPLPPPPPTTPPPPPVVVSANTTNALQYDTSTLTITGNNFDGSVPSNNVVTLNLNLTAVVLSSTNTSLSLRLLPVANQPERNASIVVPAAIQRPATGPITAIVSVPSRGTTSGPAPVQVGTLLLPKDNWRTATMTPDGSKIFLGVNRNGTIWKSTDGGVSFSLLPNAPLVSWQALSVSASGNVLIGGTSAGDLWVSSNSGITWSSAVGVPAPPNEWNAAAVSDDGTTMIAGMTSSGAIWRSGDGGSTFTIAASAPTTSRWRTVAISSDGQKMLSGALSGNLWFSSNAGGLFNQQTGPAPTTAQWRTTAMNSNGSFMAAAISGGTIYTSPDGATFTAAAGAPFVTAWTTIRMSSDGSKILACVNPGAIYLSTNYGATFTATSAPNNSDWYSLASSADVSKIIAGVFYENVYLSNDGGQSFVIR